MIDLELLWHSGRLYDEPSDMMPSTGSMHHISWTGIFRPVASGCNNINVLLMCRGVVTLIWILSWIISQTPVFERDFSPQDPLISHPHRGNTSVFPFREVVDH